MKDTKPRCNAGEHGGGTTTSSGAGEEPWQSQVLLTANTICGREQPAVNQ